MPKIADIKIIDGQPWARLELPGEVSSVCLWTGEEAERQRRDIKAACAEAAMDWFTLPPASRTKSKLREMILAP